MGIVFMVCGCFCCRFSFLSAASAARATRLHVRSQGTRSTGRPRQNGQSKEARWNDIKTHRFLTTATMPHNHNNNNKQLPTNHNNLLPINHSQCPPQRLCPIPYMRATICAIKPNPFTNPQSVKNSMDEWERQPLRRLSPTDSRSPTTS